MDDKASKVEETKQESEDKEDFIFKPIAELQKKRQNIFECPVDAVDILFPDLRSKQLRQTEEFIRNHIKMALLK